MSADASDAIPPELMSQIRKCDRELRELGRLSSLDQAARYCFAKAQEFTARDNGRGRPPR